MLGLDVLSTIPNTAFNDNTMSTHTPLLPLRTSACQLVLFKTRRGNGYAIKCYTLPRTKGGANRSRVCPCSQANKRNNSQLEEGGNNTSVAVATKRTLKLLPTYR